MKEEATRTIEVFYSYAQEDELLQKQLEKHLTILSRQGLITSWHARKIIPGTEKEPVINSHLNAAQIILLLISADFLASDYCYDGEMQQALRRHEAGEACVIPVILRPAHWKDAPFGKLQVLPTNEKPITGWPGRRGRDEAFLDVTRGIRKAVLEIRNRGPAEKSIEYHREDSKDLSDFGDFTIALIETTQRANNLYEHSSYREALDKYTQAIRLDPQYAFAYRAKGETFQKLKQYDEALVAYEQALQLDPYDINTYRDKGALLYELKRYEEALKVYEQILHIDPEDHGAFYSKGVIYSRLAQQAFEKAQQLHKGMADKV